MSIPPEREITKTQLWERMDELISGINITVAGFAKVIESQREGTINEVKVILNENVKVLVALKEELKQQHIGLKKELEQQVNDSNTFVTNRLNDFRKILDEQMKLFRQNVNEQTQNKLDSAVDQITQNIESLDKAVAEFKKGVDKQMHTYQSEMRSKYGEVVGLLNTMKKKFKKVSEQLS